MSVFQVDDLQELRACLDDAAIAAIEIDLSGCASKAALMQRCQDCLHLPAEFGHNWDALYDLLREQMLLRLSDGGKATVMVFGMDDLSRAAPEVVSALQDLLGDLVATFPPEACMAYWVAPSSPQRNDG